MCGIIELMFYIDLTICKMLLQFIQKGIGGIKMSEKLTCFDIADYFLSLVDEDVGDSISNLKLQKLVYYAQGFSLALYDKPLFPKSIQAWAHGPVVRVLYDKYRDYEANPIPKPSEIKLSRYDTTTKELLNEIYAVYGQYSAWKLRELTHEDTPWINAYRKSNKEIPHTALKKYFKTQIEDS